MFRYQRSIRVLELRRRAERRDKVREGDLLSGDVIRS
jgi:hypothetical protein